GIRDFHVTGGQTCALPIWAALRGAASGGPRLGLPRQAAGIACSYRGGRLRRLRCGARARGSPRKLPSLTFGSLRSNSRGERVNRSEERRVGEDGGCRGAPA